MHVRSIITVAICAIVAVACSDSGGGPSEPDFVNISGSWNFTERLNHETSGLSCNGSGTLIIQQSGDTFTGTSSGDAFCTVNGTLIGETSVSGPVTGGQINGQHISFVSGSCEYEGEVVGNRAEGELGCKLAVGGTVHLLAGTWEASR